MSRETDLAQRAAAAPRNIVVPAVDIVEDKSGVTVWADLPGVPKEKLEVNVHDGRLSIEAEAVIAMGTSSNGAHTEVRAPRYGRAFSISSDLDTSRIDASLQDGVLTLRIPRREVALPRRIEVKAA